MKLHIYAWELIVPNKVIVLMWLFKNKYFLIQYFIYNEVK